MAAKSLWDQIEKHVTWVLKFCILARWIVILLQRLYPELCFLYTFRRTSWLVAPCPTTTLILLVVGIWSLSHKTTHCWRAIRLRGLSFRTASWWHGAGVRGREENNCVCLCWLLRQKCLLHGSAGAEGCKDLPSTTILQETTTIPSGSACKWWLVILA